MLSAEDLYAWDLDIRELYWDKVEGCTAQGGESVDAASFCTNIP
jgi:hypothetical protein